MAVILSQITIGDIRLIVTDSTPNQGAGLNAELGSMVIVQGQNGIYLKTGDQNTDWKLSTVDAAQLGVDLQSLQDSISSEASQRQSAISELSSRVDQLDTGNDELLVGEISRAQQAEADLQQQVLSLIHI